MLIHLIPNHSRKEIDPIYRQNPHAIKDLSQSKPAHIVSTNH